MPSAATGASALNGGNGSGPLEQIPLPGERRIALRVTPAAERAIRSGHPWLFADSIRRQSHRGQAGDLAVIFDRKDRFLAVGLYDPTAPIRVRVLQAGKPATINAGWFRQRLAAAAAIRRPIPPQTNGYRLVHGENDGLPGLIIDRYGATYVLQLDTASWVPHLNYVLAELQALVAPERVVLRLSRSVQWGDDPLFGLRDGVVLAGAPLSGSVIFQENGLRFESDPRRGQKTGFFLDQRENRARVGQLAAGTRSVLNVFAYTGGFSLYAARGGAPRVVSLDISQPALAAAMRNFRLNRSEPAVAAAEHELLLGDAFQTLRQLGESGRRFGMVILDPPSFAHKQEDVEGALAAYERLARLGLAVLQPGGTLVSASCSSRIPAESFFARVHQAAGRVKRPLREIERTFHPLDHPITFREGAYLKCLFATAS